MERSINYRSFSDLSMCIRNNIYKLPQDIQLVVGIPRSGMIPAYMIALFMNKKVCSLDEFVSGIEVSTGFRKINENQQCTSEKIKVLIVDDSVCRGAAKARAEERIVQSGLDLSKYELIWMAVYAVDTAANIMDYYFEMVSLPRVFQWNYINSSQVTNSCFDIDGVLCVDPTEEQNDDGEKYNDFLLNATPLFIPRYKIHTIVTSRLEKYRPQTEAWLKNHGVEYGNLVMLDLPDKATRIRMKAHATIKSKVYAELHDTTLFYESNRKQAIQIAAATHKPVICIETDEMFFGDEDEIVFSDVHYEGNNDDNVTLEKKKILLFTHELTCTGAPTCLLRMCRLFRQRGCEVTVWSPLDGPMRERFESLGASVCLVDKAHLTSKESTDAIKNSDFAIASTIYAAPFYEVASAFIPVMWFIFEGTNLPDILARFKEYEPILMNASNLYSDSYMARDFIRRKYNANTQLLLNCVDDVYNKKENQMVQGKVEIAVVGNIMHHKGLDILLDAISKIDLETRQHIHLNVIGRSSPYQREYMDEISKRIEELECADYLGEITDQQIKYDLFERMNVFVVPSRHESCSLVVIEAMMMGKPVVISDRVGAQYMLRSDNGWIYPVNDVDALKNLITEIVSNPEILTRFGVNARKTYLELATVEFFEENMWRSAENLFKESKKGIPEYVQWSYLDDQDFLDNHGAVVECLQKAKAERDDVLKYIAGLNIQLQRKIGLLSKFGKELQVASQNTEEIRNKLRICDDSIRRRDTWIDSLNSRVKTQEDAIERRNQDIETLKGHLSKQNDAIERRNQDIETLRGHLGKQNDAIERRNKEIETLKGHLSKQNDAIERRNKEIETLKGHLSKQNDAIERRNKDIEILREKNKKVDMWLCEAKAKNERFIQTIQELKRKNEMLLASVNERKKNNPSAPIDKKFFVFGSCVSRDIFSIAEKDQLVSGYIARQSLVSCVSKPKPIDPADINLASNWQKRMVMADIMKLTPSMLAETEFDYLIIDLIDERFSLLTDGESVITCSSQLVDSGVKDKLNMRLVSLNEKKQMFADACHEFSKMIEPYAVQGRVILHEAYWADRYYENGQERFFDPDRIALHNGYLKEFYQQLKEAIPQMKVLPPIEMIADPNHRWGLEAVHYERTYYETRMNQLTELCAK